ncbi:Eukaryotic translation initiation factor 3 subunit J [Erysiphe neolycopersici]|uniref:Eukaryotic translation initiation factor 3 subunit J n=1 Tax=Erysiphe neolycopersici TaxID=212602 RepID=A0A420HMD7_9PEZI|nr:Eukaryotic translation initiation factor 3 subunit J [Erysiphe neolycopersici]
MNSVEEDDVKSTPPSSPVPAAIPRRKFEDEEDDESDVLESWDAAEDSEVEREKARVAAERKAKADAEAAANKKSKTQRIAEKTAERARRLAEECEESSEEDDATKRKRLQNFQHESDMAHAEDLFGINNTRKVTSAANAVQVEANDSNNFVDLTTLPFFNPNTKLQFEKLRDILIPVIVQNSNKAHYSIFLQEFTKQLAKELPSHQIKKIASSMTALSNEKMKEEKLAEKGGKKSKAAKTKVTLVASKNIAATPDVNAYDDDDDYGDDDFM